MKSKILSYLLLILGSVLYSIAVSAFLIPSNIGIGGITGISLSLNKVFGFKVGIMTILFNIPLFIFGYRLIGLKFSIRSGFVVLVFSILIDLLNSLYTFPPMNDRLLATIFCGTLSGIGVTLVFMGGGSTGGLDILAKIIIYKFKGLNLSNVLLVQDIIIYIIVSFALGIDAVMYAFIMSFIRTKTLDTLQEGISASKQCIIICENYSEITQAIQSKLIRGVTLLDALGAFSNKDKKLIYVVIQKNQLNQLRGIVKSIEPNAFVAVSNVNDILGNYRQSISI
jgi:uncharacterized membrane-anchored protein YitT (DUF2179 family)